MDNIRKHKKSFQDKDCAGKLCTHETALCGSQNNYRQKWTVNYNKNNVLINMGKTIILLSLLILLTKRPAHTVLKEQDALYCGFISSHQY